MMFKNRFKKRILPVAVLSTVALGALFGSLHRDDVKAIEAKQNDAKN